MVCAKLLAHAHRHPVGFPDGLKQPKILALALHHHVYRVAPKTRQRGISSGLQFAHFIGPVNHAVGSVVEFVSAPLVTISQGHNIVAQHGGSFVNVFGFHHHIAQALNVLATVTNQIRFCEVV